MKKRNLLITILLLLATAAVADEYTDSLTGVVYTHEKGSGVAKVKDGVYHAWDARTRGTIPLAEDIVILDSFLVDDCRYAVKEIGNYAFYYKDIISVKIPSTVTAIGDYVFRGSSKLQTVNLPESLEAIGIFSFSDCNKLTSVVWPSQMTTIPKGTFMTCRRLREVILPENLTEIGDMSFTCCSSLREIVIPGQVTRIGMGAFSDCDSLSKVTIPSRVTSIGSYAFNRAPRLTIVISQIEEPFDIDVNVFGDETNENATLYVPVGSKAKYETAAGWSRFKTIVEGSPTAIYIPSATQQNMKGSIYDLYGRKISGQPQKGLYIQDGKKRVCH
jgi:hypothetical protein